ncbi:MAG: hypothetical protein H6594_12290 [Flavobacteriales bacterium]|nr:hypothetical protein [Flavobacteriales bacterium]
MRPRSGLVLFLAFLLSVAVRLPQLGRPLSKNHEFCTALVLVVHRVWNADGLLDHQGCPAVTFPDPGDQGVIGLHYDLTQRDGCYYYMSHLPMAYWVPYLAFRLAHVLPDVLPLEVFNLLLHAAAAFLLFGFVRVVLHDTGDPRARTVGLLSAVLYLFMPAPLWYHGNVYMSDMAVQLPWAWALFTFSRLMRDERPVRRRMTHFLVAMAVLAATEWLAVFVMVTFGAVMLQRSRAEHEAAWSRSAIAQAMVVVLVMFACLALYASVVGAEHLMTYYMHRFNERGLLAGTSDIPLSRGSRAMMTNLMTAWWPALILLVIALMGMKRASGWSGPKRIAILTLPPALIHLFVFMRYDVHEFALLKLGFFICPLAAWATVQTAQQWQMRSAVPVMCCAFLGAAYYTWVNRPGDGTATGSPYALQRTVGRFIAREAGSDEVVLLEGLNADPQVQFYAERSMRTVADSSAATQVLEELGMHKGFLVRYGSKGITSQHLRIGPRGAANKRSVSFSGLHQVELLKEFRVVIPLAEPFVLE